MFQVSNMIKIEKSADMVWALISSPGHLNQFHPFCEQNKVLESKNDVILKDSIPLAKTSKKIKVLSCAQLFAEVMYNVHHNKSISGKFIM